METPSSGQTPGARDRPRRLVPRSARVRASLLAAAALLAFVLALALGKSTADSRAPLRTAGPLVPRSQAVEIRGLPAARTLPALRPRPEPARSRTKGPKPVLVVGEG
jgi:hypothetical protein